MEKYPENLKIENQLCFPLYVVSKEIIRKYKPFLDEFGMTYTQYIVMLVLWEFGKTNVKDLGEKVYLDSGTLTPLLKKLEAKNYITKTKGIGDEREIFIDLTEEGKVLRDKVTSVPYKIGCLIDLTPEEAAVMYKLLYQILGGLEK